MLRAEGRKGGREKVRKGREEKHRDLEWKKNR